MIGELNHLLWLLPSTQSFLRDCSEELSSGVSLIVALPNAYDPSTFAQILLTSNGLQELRLRVVNLPDQTENPKKVDNFFCEVLQYRSMDEIFTDNFRPDLVYLSGFDRIPGDTRQAWLLLIQRWSRMSHGSGVRSALLTTMSAHSLCGLSLPDTDTRFKYRLWKSIPSATELRLLCRLASDSNSPEMVWREVILPSLAGNDIGLIEWLWDDIFGSSRQLIERIKTYLPTHWDGRLNSLPVFHEMNWRNSRTIDNNRFQADSLAFKLWSAGLISDTHEYGREIHPTQLLCHHQEIKAKRYIWRAQASLMLPMIAEICLELTQQFTDAYGSRDWVVYSQSEKQDGVVPLEMSDLKVSLEEGLKDRRCRGWYDHWYSDVVWARDVRNCLAHGDVIEFSDFTRLVQFLERARNNRSA